MELKGLENLNKAVATQLAPFGIADAVCTTNFSYVFSTNVITFTIVEGTIEDNMFNNFIEDRFGYEVTNSFIMSLLHEIGHHMTDEDINDNIYEFCFNEKKRIDEEMQSAETMEDAERLEYQYFNLPDEIMATQWAVNFAKKHPKKVRKMWKLLEPAFWEFYEVNNVCED